MDKEKQITIYLDPRKERALAMMMEGRKDTEIAKELNIARVTLYRWRVDDIHFIKALNERRELLKQRAREGLLELTGAALKAIIKSLASRDPRVRLQAAKYILSHFNLQEESKHGSPIIDLLTEALSGIEEELGVKPHRG